MKRPVVALSTKPAAPSLRGESPVARARDSGHGFHWSVHEHSLRAQRAVPGRSDRGLPSHGSSGRPVSRCAYAALLAISPLGIVVGGLLLIEVSQQDRCFLSEVSEKH